MSKSGEVEVEVKVYRTTRAAILVEFGGSENVWVPRSLITDWCGGPDDAPGLQTTSIFIPEWFAIKAGLV